MKDKLLAAAAVRKKEVTIGGEKCTVREVSALDFGKYGSMMKTDKEAAMAFLIAVSLVDAEDKPLLTDDEARLLLKTARIATPLMNSIMNLNGFGDDDDKEGGSEKHADAS